MGLFGNLFGGATNDDGKEKEKQVPWIPLVSLEQLDEIERHSTTKTQVIFKHSTSCGISRMVMNMFNAGYKFTDDQIDLYYLDLHAYREISQGTSTKFGVIHESPQLLVVRNGITVRHASHGAINDVELGTYV